jgi:membrane protease subunit (stomatin/prohibitin family)
VAYTKAVTLPSVTKGQPASDVIQHPRTAAQALVLAFGMLGGAVVAFGGGTVLWTSYQRRRQASSTRQDPPLSLQAAVRPHAQTTFAPIPTTSGRNVPNFCSNCGAKLRPEYRFCPGCGKPLHRNA